MIQTTYLYACMQEKHVMWQEYNYIIAIDTCDGSGLVHCEILESPNTTKNLSDPLVIGDMALIRCGRISDVPVFFNIDEVVQNRDSAFTNWSQLILTRTHFIFVLYSPASLSNSVFKITSGRNFPHQCLAKATLINSGNNQCL